MNDFIDGRVANNLRLCRLASGVTTTYICAKLQISQQHLLDIEDAKEPLSFFQLMHFAAMFNQPLHFFFGIADGPIRQQKLNNHAEFDDTAKELHDLSCSFLSILNPHLRAALPEIAHLLMVLDGKGYDFGASVIAIPTAATARGETSQRKQ